MKATFVGVDNPTVPEEWCTGPKEYCIDGDIGHYTKFVKMTSVPDAYEFLVNPNYFRRFKMLKSDDVSMTEANKAQFGGFGAPSVKFPWFDLISTFLLTLLFAYFAFFVKPDATIPAKTCKNDILLTLFFYTFFTWSVIKLPLIFMRYSELLARKRDGIVKSIAQKLYKVIVLAILGTWLYANIILFIGGFCSAISQKFLLIFVIVIWAEIVFMLALPGIWFLAATCCVKMQ